MVATWIRLAVVTTVGIVQAPVLFRWVPAPELGVWYLLFALALFLNLSDLGLPTALTRAVAFVRGRDRAPGEPGDARDVPSVYRTLSLPGLYASGLIATAGLSVAFAAIGFPAALLYFRVAVPDYALRASLASPLLVFLAAVVVNMVAGISSACLNGAGELGWDNAIRTVTSLLGFVLIWLLVPSHPTLAALCWIYLVQGVFFLLATHLAVVRLLRTDPLARMRTSLPVIRFMYREAVPVFVTRLGTWLVQEMNLLVAGYFLGPDRVPDLAIMRQVVAIGTALISAIPIAVSPHISAAHAGGDAERVLSLYLATIRFSLVLAILWATGALVWTPDVLEMMVGPGHFLGYAVLVPLAVGSFLEQHTTAHGQFLWSVGRWPFAPLYVTGGVLNAVLASAGCALYGFPGLAWGSLLSQATTVYWKVSGTALRHIGLSLRAYARGSLLGPALFAALLGAAAVAIRLGLASTFSSLLATTPRLGLAALVIAGVGATTAAAALLAWPLALTAGDREYLLRLARIRRR